MSDEGVFVILILRFFFYPDTCVENVDEKKEEMITLLINKMPSAILISNEMFTNIRDFFGVRYYNMLDLS